MQEIFTFDYPKAIDQKRKHDLCGKIAGIFREDQCSIGQALEVLEETKNHLLKYVLVTAKSDLKEY